MEHMVWFHGQETGSGPVLSDNDLQRLLCHVLVNRMPEDGLPELAGSLRDMYEFYESRVVTAALPAPRREVHLELAEIREREPFSISEE